MASVNYSSGSMKKHKKHKSERRERTDSPAAVDKPGLKLILKVGSQATPEHTTDFGYNPAYSVHGAADDSSQPMDTDAYLSLSRSHHKKSKKKKKKKDKAKDRDRKHRHHHKEKKRKREEVDYDEEQQFGEVGSPSHREPRTCVLRQRQERTALQRMLDHMLGLLEKKDPQQFFAWPVTDNIAPGYSSIISQPMDFSTMRQKIEDNQYESLQDFSADFKLMCTNAMKYNHIDTIYYKASKKLLHAGTKILQPEKLGWLLSLIPDLTSDDMGFEITPELRQLNPLVHPSTDDDQPPAPTPTTATITTTTAIPMPSLPPKPLLPATKFEPIQDDLTADEILTKSTLAAREARAKLINKRNTLGYLKQRKDGGATSLHIVVGGDGVIPGTKKRPILLGALTGKLAEGTGQVQGFREDRRNAAKPVKPLYYGAFGSYAPSYDSAFANLTKDESDLVLQTYGSESAVQYAESVLDFVKDSNYATDLVDSLLNLLTGGDHLKTKKCIEESKKLREEEEAIKAMLESRPLDAIKIDVNELKSLETMGINIDFLDAMEEEIKAGEERHEMRMRLDSMGDLLARLQERQHARLSAPVAGGHLGQCAQASDEEVGMAESVSEGLGEMVKKAGGPGEVVSVGGLRKAMGAGGGQQQQEEVDLELELRRFLESEGGGLVGESPLRVDKTIEEILME